MSWIGVVASGPGQLAVFESTRNSASYQCFQTKGAALFIKLNLIEKQNIKKTKHENIKYYECSTVLHTFLLTC